MPAYIVTGSKAVQKVLNSPEILDGNWIQIMLMDKYWGMTSSEISKFANDKSRRSEVPFAGTETPEGGKRYWLGHDKLYANFLSTRKASNALASSFSRLFADKLDVFPKEEWKNVNLFAFLKESIAESAIVSLFGQGIIGLNPRFVEAYWEFDEVTGSLALGLPRIFQRKAARARDRLHEMTERHIEEAWRCFDWEGPDKNADWERHFGSRLSRETARWLREGGFSNRAVAGHTLASLFRLNGNTVPITTWILIELIKDPVLFQQIRTKALSCFTPTLSAEKLTKLPLMQSIYIEALRLRVSFNATRKTTQSIIFDGYAIEKGALVQTCSEIAHYEEEVWGVEGHPASEFWGERHVRVVEGEGVDEKGRGRW